MVGDSGRFSRRTNDKSHRRRLASAQRIFQKYQSAPQDILEEVDLNQKIFHIASETSPNTKYTVTLSTHFCDCGSSSSTCKHILALQMIVKEFYGSLNDEVPLHHNGNDEPTFQCIEENPHGQDSFNEGYEETTHAQHLLQVIQDMESMLLEVKTNIDKYGEEEMKYKMETMK